MFEAYSEDQKKAQIKKVCPYINRWQRNISINAYTMQTNGIFELRVKNAEGKEAIWTIDMKTTGSVYKGGAKSKPNVTILLSDDTFQQLADGKVSMLHPYMKTAAFVIRQCGV